MFTFGDLLWTTQLFRSSNIDELMAEPPVAGAARRPAADPVSETASVTRLFHSPEIGELMSEPPAAAGPVSAGSPRRGRQRAAA